MRCVIAILRISIVLVLIIFSAGLAFARNSLWERSDMIWGDTIKKSPQLFRAYNNSGLFFIMQGRVLEAMKMFKEVVRLDDNPEGHSNLGNTYAIRGRLREAVVEFERAIELKPDYSFAIGNLANAYLMLGRIDDGIEMYKRVFVITPDAHDVRINLAIAYQSKGMYREARVELDKYLKWYPNDMRALQMSRSLPY